MPGSSEIWFATSNGHKFQEASIALRTFGISLGRLPSKGEELQSDNVQVIARRAASEAFLKYQLPLFVEDTALFVDRLKGFPGPYAAYVNRTVGPESLVKLLEGVANREAEFVSAVAFVGERGTTKTFVGRLKGTISRESLGTNGFGFDPVFIPEGMKLTLAELPIEEKVPITHRTRALAKLGAWLAKKK